MRKGSILLMTLLGVLMLNVAVAVLPVKLNTANYFSPSGRNNDSVVSIAIKSGNFSGITTPGKLYVKVQGVTIYSDTTCTQHPVHLDLSSNAFWRSPITISGSSQEIGTLHLYMSALTADAALMSPVVIPVADQCAELDILYAIQQNTRNATVNELLASSAVLQCQSMTVSGSPASYSGCTISPSEGITVAPAGMLAYNYNGTTNVGNNSLIINPNSGSNNVTGTITIKNIGSAGINSFSTSIPTGWSGSFSTTDCTASPLAAGSSCTYNYSIPAFLLTSNPSAFALSASGTDTLSNNVSQLLPIKVLQTGPAQCWGNNNHGQLGDGSTDDKNTPVAVSDLSTGVVAIATGQAHTCALLNTGGVKCWGNNDSGQLGDGTTTDRSTPVAVSDLSNATAIATGDYHTCALLNTGGVKCWGYNGYGELGDGSNDDQSSPVSVVGEGGSGFYSNGLFLGQGLGLHQCAIQRAVGQ